MGGDTPVMNAAALFTAKQQLRVAIKKRLAALPQDTVEEQSRFEDLPSQVVSA